MPDRLYRLVYYSSNRVPAARTTAEIESILASARRNNAALDVTGALLFNDGCFAQVLEGRRAALEELFERIQNDPRHADATVLQFEEAAARSFPAWSMGFVGRSPDAIRRHGGVAAATGFDPSLLDGEEIFTLLRELAVEEEGVTAA